MGCIEISRLIHWPSVGAQIECTLQVDKAAVGGVGKGWQKEICQEVAAAGMNKKMSDRQQQDSSGHQGSSLAGVINGQKEIKWNIKSNL